MYGNWPPLPLVHTEEKIARYLDINSTYKYLLLSFVHVCCFGYLFSPYLAQTGVIYWGKIYIFRLFCSLVLCFSRRTQRVLCFL